MDKKWRNLFLIFVVLAVIAGITYFLFFSSPSGKSFDSGLQKIDAIWQTNGINPYSFTAEELQKKSESLDSIEVGLSTFRKKSSEETPNNPPILSLAGIHASLIEEMKINRQLKGLITETDSLETTQLCGNYSKFDGMHVLTLALVEKIKQKNSAINSFILQYPSEAEKSGVSRILTSKDGFDTMVSESTEGIELLRQSCEASE